MEANAQRVEGSQGVTPPAYREPGDARMNLSEDDLEAMIEIRDPEIDVEDIVPQVRARLRAQHRRARGIGLDCEALARGQVPSDRASPLDDDLEDNLERMRASYNRVVVDLSLTKSRVPIVGPLVQRIREPLHRLAMYYVNRSAGRQSRFNAYVVGAMANLIRSLGEENERLRQEISRLDARLTNLETNARGKRE